MAMLVAYDMGISRKSLCYSYKASHSTRLEVFGLLAYSEFMIDWLWLSFGFGIVAVAFHPFANLA